MQFGFGFIDEEILKQLASEFSSVLSYNWWNICRTIWYVQLIAHVIRLRHPVFIGHQLVVNFPLSPSPVRYSTWKSHMSLFRAKSERGLKFANALYFSHFLLPSILLFVLLWHLFRLFYLSFLFLCRRSSCPNLELLIHLPLSLFLPFCLLLLCRLIAP